MRTNAVTTVLGLLVLVAALTFSNAATGAPDVQRMRIPIGSYWVGGGGGVGGAPPDNAIPLGAGDDDGSFRLPAFCIDRGRHAPNSDTELTAFSGNIVVTRYKNGKAIEHRAIDEAVSGTNPWLKFKGIGVSDGSFRDIAVTPLDSNYQYKMTVSGLALTGVDEQDLSEIHTGWSTNQDLQRVSAVFDGLRTSLLQPGSAGKSSVELLEDIRQDFEWEAFGRAPGGAVLPTGALDYSKLRADLSGLVSSSLTLQQDVDVEEILDWLRITTAILPGKTQLAELEEKLTGVGFKGTTSFVDSANTAAILKAYRSAYQGESWWGFRSVRKEKSSSFDDALRMVALSLFREEELTSGRVDVETLDYLDCSNLEGADGYLGGEQLLAEDLAKRTDLAKALGVYATGGRLVKISARNDKLCFQWINKDKVESRIVDLEGLTKEYLVAIGGDLWLIDDEISNLAETFSNLGVKVETARALELRLAARAQNESEMAGDLHIRSFHRAAEQTNGLDVSILNLPTNGDSSVVKLPDGSLMIVDTGLGADTVEQLRSFILRAHKRDKPPIRLLITHTDKDHIGGLVEILDAGFQLDEVIIGTSKTDKEKPERVNLVTSAFAAKNYDIVTTDSAIQMKRRGVSGLIDIRNPTSTYLGNLEGWRLYLGDQTEISLYHATDAAKPNDAGFLVKLVSRGKALLLTDDLSASTLAKMSDGLGHNILHAGFLKWPHHLWFPPGKSSAREMLQEFINIVNPHTVAFSGVGHPTHDQRRYEEICSYLRGQVVESVGCYWTRGRKANLAFEL